MAECWSRARPLSCNESCNGCRASTQEEGSGGQASLGERCHHEGGGMRSLRAVRAASSHPCSGLASMKVVRQVGQVRSRRRSCPHGVNWRFCRPASRCWAPADLTTCDPSPHSTQPSLQIHRWKASPGRPRPPPQTKHTETRSIAARPAARSGSEGPRSRVAPRTGMLLTPPVAGGGALADEGKGVGGAVCEKRTDDVRPPSRFSRRVCGATETRFLAAR